jgi:predicted MFS family arabinose efflux permease
LAAVLALDSADKGVIGATAMDLQDAFSVGPTGIGFLLTVSSLVAVAATIPFGMLVDRVSRVHLLFVVVLSWGVAMIAGATASSYLWLLGSRLLLGAAAAVAYPAVASLVGDWFPGSERGRVLGLIAAGELVGTGLGLLIAGGTAVVVSWRLSFTLVGLGALGVAWMLHRLPEPARGGASRMAAGSRDVAAGDQGESSADVARSLVRQRGVAPDDDTVVSRDVDGLSLWEVLRYVLRIRTNVVLIISSSLGYYMFAGVRTFGVEFAEGHYGLSRSGALAVVFVGGVGGIVGVVAGGRISDTLLARGHVDARIVVPAVSFLAMTAVFAPAVVTTSLLVAVPLLVLAACFLSLANPPLDAARLDVVPSALWGRAEAMRTVLRTALEALAPLAFGATAEYIFGGTTNSGLEATMLVMLVPLVASPLVLLLARRSYPSDVASAAASETRSVDGAAT